MCGPIDESIRQGIDAEFALSFLEQLAHSYETRRADLEPVLRKLVDGFIDGGSYCPGFRFVHGGALHPVVVGLIDRAMALKVPPITSRPGCSRPRRTLPAPVRWTCSTTLPASARPLKPSRTGEGPDHAMPVNRNDTSLVYRNEKWVR